MSTTATSPLVATCHCKDFKLLWSAPVESVTRCNCTFCGKRGALWAYGTPADLQVLKRGDDVLYLASPDSPNRHHHCGRCGCTLYNENPDYSAGAPDPTKPIVAINANLFDDVVATDLPTIVLDGRNQW